MSGPERNTESKLGLIEYTKIKAVLALDDDVRAELNSNVELELELIERMKRFIEAADSLAHIKDGVIGDIFEVGEKANQVESSLPQDNIWLLEAEALSGIKGEFPFVEKPVSDYDGFFGAMALDIDTGKIVVEGYGERNPQDEYGPPLSKFAFIMDPKLRLQNVEIIIVKDGQREPDTRPAITTLIERLRKTEASDQPA